MRLQSHQLAAFVAHEKSGSKEAFIMPPPIKRAKRSYEESENQVALFKWWAITHHQFGVPSCCMFAIPNGSALGTGKEDWQVKQRMIRGKRLKAEGLTPGVFDIFVAAPRHYCHDTGTEKVRVLRSGLFVEMKRREGEPSKDQLEFQAAMIAQGYKTVFCYSTQEAINEITTYLT